MKNILGHKIVKKWGDSLIITLTKDEKEILGLEEGSEVTVCITKRESDENGDK